MRKFFENGDYIEYVKCDTGYMVSMVRRLVLQKKP